MIDKKWGKLDFLVHAIAFSDKEELTAATSTPRATISSAPWTSRSISFTAVAKRAEPLMTDGGSLLTLTYYGAEKVMPHYNVMGVAKAALEASVRYLAVDLGGKQHPRQRDLGRPDQDACRLGHRRLPLHPEVERIQRAAAADGDDRGSRRVRHVFPVRSVARRDGRNPSCRFRLPCRRHEGGRRAGHLRRQGMSGRSSERRHFGVRCLRLSISFATARPTGMPKAGCRVRRRLTLPSWAAAGRPQRRRLRELIGDPAQFDFVASPMRRTRETMERVRIAMGLPPDGYRTDARLVEVHFGDWQGFTFAELEAIEPGCTAARSRDKWNFVPPGEGAESYEMLMERVRPWFEALDRPTVCVTHGGVIRAIFRMLTDTPSRQAARLEIFQDRVLRLRGEHAGVALS